MAYSATFNEVVQCQKNRTTFCFLLVASIHLQAPGLSSGHSSERIDLIVLLFFALSLNTRNMS
ncbi:unnamed protein product [Ixodes hexagonus]